MTARKTLLLVTPLLSSIAVASAVLGAGGNDPRTPGLTAPSVTTADDTPIETTTTSTTAPDVLAAAFEAPPSTEPPHEPAADETGCARDEGFGCAPHGTQIGARLA